MSIITYGNGRTIQQYILTERKVSKMDLVTEILKKIQEQHQSGHYEEAIKGAHLLIRLLRTAKVLAEKTSQETSQKT